jgi:hypothetical protein
MLLARLTILTTKGEGLLSVVGLVALCPLLMWQGTTGGIIAPGRLGGWGLSQRRVCHAVDAQLAQKDQSFWRSQIGRILPVDTPPGANSSIVAPEIFLLCLSPAYWSLPRVWLPAPALCLAAGPCLVSGSCPCLVSSSRHLPRVWPIRVSRLLACEELCFSETEGNRSRCLVVMW